MGRPSGSAARCQGRRRRRIPGKTPSTSEGGSGRARFHLNGRGPAAGSPTRGAHLSGSSPTSRSNRAEARGGVSGDLPAPQGVSGDALHTGVPRGPGRIQPWVARSPRGTGLSRVLAAADEAGGDGGHGTTATGRSNRSAGKLRGVVEDGLGRIGGGDGARASRI